VEIKYDISQLRLAWTKKDILPIDADWIRANYAFHCVMPTGVIGPIHLVEEIIAIAKIC